MSARLAVTCDGPDCPTTTTAEPTEWPAGGWLHVHIDDHPDQAGHLIADYCGWTCYAADVVRRAMEEGTRV